MAMTSILQFDPGSSAARAPAPGEPVPASLRALQLTNRLQASLDPQEVVARFADELLEAGDVDGLRYRDPESGRERLFGRRTLHSAAYRLVIDGEDLGEVALLARRRFVEERLRDMETLLCALVYPLRNALRFRRLERCARLDPLTGTGNRAALDAELARQIDLADRRGHTLSVLLLDIDRFKSINDGYGHAAGDAILREFAARAGAVIRRSDLLYRYGGEEFVLILPECDTAGAAALAERIRRAVANRPHSWAGRSIPVTVSIGVAERAAGEPAPALLERADRALYAAKEAGRDRIRTAAPPPRP